MRPDGSELSLQIGFEHRISHFAWPDPDRLLISTDLLGPMQFLTFTVDRRDFTPFGRPAPAARRPRARPDGRWLACDTYPQGSERVSALMLYEMAARRRVDIGGMYSEPVFTGDVRCDLHLRRSSYQSRVSTASASACGRKLTCRLTRDPAACGGLPPTALPYCGFRGVPAIENRVPQPALRC